MNNEENRHIGLWSTVLLGLNGIIGSGIFLLPGTVTHLVGSWSIVVYLFVTLIVLSIAWCFAQCATLFNRNGGAYVYAKEAFGDFVGFEIGIMRWVVGMLAWASLIVGFITVLGYVWPSVLDEPYRTLLILAIVGGLGLLNIVGITVFKQINNIVTIAKVIPLLMFILLGLFFVKSANYIPLELDELKEESFGAAALIVFYAFSGFETLTVAAGEMKNSRKNLPFAIMLVITFCSFLYLIIQFLAMGILGDSLSESQMPLVDAAQLLLGESGKWIVLMMMLISIGGINLSASFFTPRSGAALADDGMIPRQIGVKGRFGTPTCAILVTIGVTGVLALSGSFAQLAMISVISRFAQHISTCLAVIVLHKKIAPSKSVMKKILFVLSPTTALFGIGWLILQAAPMQLVWGLGALLLGIPLYYLQRPVRVLQEIV